MGCERGWGGKTARLKGKILQSACERKEQTFSVYLNRP